LIAEHEQELNLSTKTIPITESDASMKTSFGAVMKKFLSARETGVFIALILMSIFLSFATDSFFTVKNLLNIGRQVSLLGIMAIGMLYVLISKEIDLSVGATYALAAIVTGILIVQQWPLWLTILIGLGMGLLVGLLIGVVSTYGKLPSFITTLGMMSVIRGAALLITDGKPVTVNERFGADPVALQKFYFLAQGRLFDTIPMQLVFFAVIILIAYILLAKTVFGFKIYAVGGSDRAARVSGIKVFNVKISAFMIMGFLAALAGILSLSFLPSAQAGRTGVGLELDVIAAPIIGGASLGGGEGTILGTVLGVFIVGILRNGLVLMGISPFWQEVAIGSVIILAVGVDKWTRARREA
jgi:ribose transport system permease protein